MTARVIRNPFSVDLPKRGPIDTSITFRMTEKQAQVYEDFSLLQLVDPLGKIARRESNKSDKSSEFGANGGVNEVPQPPDRGED